jgi:hypothetical protein
MDKLPKIEDAVVESIEEDVMDVDMKQIANEEEENNNNNPVEEQIIERVKVPQEEIFGTSSRKQNDTPEIKKVKKPKRQISEAQRERLAKGREKALANRRAKALAKKQAKENKEKEYESIPEKHREEFKKTAVEEVKREPPVSKMLSEEQVAKISAEATKKALEDYDILRKQRKQEKLKKQEEENHRKKIRNTIQRATQRDTTFDFCFA